jgi:hypothetical protein
MKALFSPKPPDITDRISLFEGSQALPVCPSGKNNMWMNE